MKKSILILFVLGVHLTHAMDTDDSHVTDLANTLGVIDLNAASSVADLANGITDMDLGAKRTVLLEEPDLIIEQGVLELPISQAGDSLWVRLSKYVDANPIAQKPGFFNVVFALNITRSKMKTFICYTRKSIALAVLMEKISKWVDSKFNLYTPFCKIVYEADRIVCNKKVWDSFRIEFAECDTPYDKYTGHPKTKEGTPKLVNINDEWLKHIAQFNDIYYVLRENIEKCPIIILPLSTPKPLQTTASQVTLQDTSAVNSDTQE